MSRKNERMFARLTGKSAKTKKWLFFPLSMMVHMAVIASVIVLPLIGESVLPEVNVTDVFMVMPSPPAPPPPPRGGRAKKDRARTEKKVAKKVEQVQTGGRIVEPVKIPQDIDEPDLDMFVGTGGGDVIGAPEVPGAPDDIFKGDAFIGGGNSADSGDMLGIRVIPPKLIKRVKPIYPKMAREARVQGTVVIEAVTDVYGRVVKTRFITGNPLLKKAALEAIKKWVYEPYILCGMPKPVVFTVSIHFRLDG